MAACLFAACNEKGSCENNPDITFSCESAIDKLVQNCLRKVDNASNLLLQKPTAIDILFR